MDEGTPIACCRSCGCYSSHAAVGLSKVCDGGLRGRRSKLRRFMRGLHPKRKDTIDGPWPGVPALEMLCGDVQRHWTEQTPAAGPEASLPRAADPEVFALGVQAGFDDPDGPGDRPDEDASDPVEPAFAEPPGDVAMSFGSVEDGEPPLDS